MEPKLKTYKIVLELGADDKRPHPTPDELHELLCLALLEGDRKARKLLKETVTDVTVEGTAESGE